MDGFRKFVLGLVLVSASLVAIHTGIHVARENEHAHPHSLSIAVHDPHARSGRWPAVRRQYIEQHGECAACGATDDLQVHHVRPYHLFPDKELDPDNLITLCGAPHGGCHLWLGHLRDFKAANPFVREDAARYRKHREARVYELKDWPAEVP